MVGTALNEAESPVMNRVQVLGSHCSTTWEAYLGWETRGFSQRGSSLALNLLVHERNKAALLVSLSTHNTREYQRVPTQ